DVDSHSAIAFGGTILERAAIEHDEAVQRIGSGNASAQFAIPTGAESAAAGSERSNGIVDRAVVADEDADVRVGHRGAVNDGAGSSGTDAEHVVSRVACANGAAAAGGDASAAIREHFAVGNQRVGIGHDASPAGLKAVLRDQEVFKATIGGRKGS